MRNPFRWLSRSNRPAPVPARHRRPDRVRPVGAGNTGRYYRSAAYRPLCAERVRGRRFPLVRRGLDPGEVTAFLHRVAGDLAALRAELDRTRDENARLKQSLRDWQSRFTPRVYR
ncbi:DivIVA domain-containing protein [Micromonospora cathayae]|uniref:DivIVA domain-containing protein n=1 Tax=Micromonospora cathayae TaxID=3028804 RepID=A0ABY7ZRH9_9ACTN|nr:DivIVA domain-containing protein [Micromonospora sp. HUAS 3]WDZ85555.1 DivIVA domain-containing protein [Micromonospora sp. HUAS 3]